MARAWFFVPASLYLGVGEKGGGVACHLNFMRPQKKYTRSKVDLKANHVNVDIILFGIKITHIIYLAYIPLMHNLFLPPGERKRERERPHW